MRRGLLKRFNPKRLHGDERGQIIPLFIISAMAMVLLISLVFNTGFQTNARVRVQNAADSVAMSQATWVARSLNVMAMNNVAISQSFSLHVLIFAILPQLYEMLIRAPIEFAEHTAICIDSLGLAFTSCIKAYRAGRAFVDTIRAFVDLGGVGVPPRKGRLFGEYTLALAQANGDLVKEFPKLSAKFSKQLTEDNGFSKEPLFYPSYLRNSDAQDEDNNGINYDSLPLPVNEPSTLMEALGDVGSLFGALGDVGAASDSESLGYLKEKIQLCASGWFGHPEWLGPVSPDVYHNFVEHGYQTDVGPYKRGRDTAAKKMNEIQDWFGYSLGPFTLWSDDLIFDFDDIKDAAWPVGCVVQTVFGGFQLVPPEWPPGGLTTFDVYTLRNTVPFLPVDGRIPGGTLGGGNILSNLGDLFGGGGGLADKLRLEGLRRDWNILAVMYHPNSTGMLAPDYFPNPVENLYAFAQAEVYNEKFYDLYTQDWRAKLVPATVITDKEYRREVERALRARPDLRDLASALDRLDEVESINAH